MDPTKSPRAKGDPLAAAHASRTSIPVGRGADARIALLEAEIARAGAKSHAPLTIAQAPTPYSSDERAPLRGEPETPVQDRRLMRGPFVPTLGKRAAASAARWSFVNA
jgi:hypothetical protein